MFRRLIDGWNLAISSFGVIRDNKGLVLFPIMSLLSMTLIVLSFLGVSFAFIGKEAGIEIDPESPLIYVVGYLFYLVNYFITIFFNVGLTHCAVQAMRNKKVKVSDGLRVARLRMGQILLWAMISATVGMLLEWLAQSGKIGQFIAGLIGIAWSAMTFFVIPVVIYEDRSAIDSIKRSGSIIKEKWGEALVGTFSFGLIYILIIIPFGIIAALLMTANPMLAVATAVLGVGLAVLLVNTAQGVFVAAMYMHVRGRDNRYFSGNEMENAFEPEVD